MQSGNKPTSFQISYKSIIILILTLIISFLFFFRYLFFQPTLILKSFGELSIDPEIAFNNDKPTFLEFYAEWCEVCKEMAPKVAVLRDEYNEDFNFVFLNVDNPKWERYIRQFNVNGIPQINLIDSKGSSKYTFIGKQEEETITNSINNLNNENNANKEIFNSNLSLIKENKNYKASVRSHG